MDSLNYFKNKITYLTESNFEETALEVFQFQSKNNPVYESYLQHLGVRPEQVDQIHRIPFLPISFFKNHEIKTGTWTTQKTFKSSGTTKTGRSQHPIEDLDFYLNMSVKNAEPYFGKLAQFEVCGLLPSYQEQGDSSLIEMVNHFAKHSLSSSGFYLQDKQGLINLLNSSDHPVLVFGVSYALLDLADQVDQPNWLGHTFVETGGMKGRKKEITRHELHEKLKRGFGTEKIHTEYGMTELMSQAYGSDGALSFPIWSKAMIRDLNDPFDVSTQGSGGLNVIDLANIHSCAFIETGDIGKIQENGTFEVLGRLDNSDIRGCSLLI